MLMVPGWPQGVTAHQKKPGPVWRGWCQGDYDGSGQQSCKCNYVDFSK